MLIYNKITLVLIIVSIVQTQCRDNNNTNKLKQRKLRKQQMQKQQPFNGDNNSIKTNKNDDQEVCSLNMLRTLPYWNCEFDTHGCGIYNQPNMPSMFGLIRSSSEVYGRRGVLSVDTSNRQSSGARLITPYFPTNGCRFGCLTIEFLMYGRSPNIFYIIQQDSDNFCLYQHNHKYGTNNGESQWNNASVTVKFSNGKPRFFIETRFNYEVIGDGFVAIANMDLKYGACSINDGNSCDLNPYISIRRS